MNRWIVLLAACLINLFAGSIYAWSVFAPAKAAQLSQVLNEALGPQDLAIMFSMANAMCPVTMILGGLITDNFGVKKVLFLGGAFICFGLNYSGLSETFIELFIAYGICFGLGIGLVYGAVIGNTIKFFPDRRGLVAGLTSASYGVCSVFLPPLANFCIGRFGISVTFELIGTVTGIVIWACAFIIPSTPPDSLLDHKSSAREYSWYQMIREPIFLFMFFSLFAGSFSGMLIASQATNITKELIGTNLTIGALIVSLFALSNTIGRIIVGIISDKFSCFFSCIGSLSLTIGGLVLLFLSPGLHAVVLAIGIIGFSMGGIMGTFPAFTTDEFGQKNNSSNYGIMFIAVAVSGFIAPVVGMNSYNLTGSYEMTFLVAIVTSLLGILALFITFFLQQHKIYLWKDIAIFVRGKFSSGS